MPRSSLSRRAVLAAALLLPALVVHADDRYPVHPIRLVVGFAPGGSTDVAARVLAERLRTELGQPVIVENRPGAGGMLATTAVTSAPADGYTLLVGNTSLVLATVFQKEARFDPARDLALVAPLVKVDSILTVPGSSGVASFAQFETLMRSTADKSYATPGAGTLGHLMSAWVAMKTGAKETVAVHYRGPGPSEPDFLAGLITYRFDTVTATRRLGAKVRCLATLTERRLPELPQCPTFAEVGIPMDVDWTQWTSLDAPAATPKAVVERLRAAVGKVAKSPDYLRGLDRYGLVSIADQSPEAFAALLQRQSRDWGTAVRRMGITLD